MWRARKYQSEQVCVQHTTARLPLPECTVARISAPRLPSLSREQAKTMIKERGGKVSSAVSSKTDYLLSGEDPGSKADDAEERKIPIINEKEFLSLLEH